MYNDNIRLNIEQKTQRGYPSNSNGVGNFSNGSQGNGRNSTYQSRGGGRGGNRAPYRGSGSNQRRGGGQFNTNSTSFGGGDENSNEYRANKVQGQV